MCLDSSDSGIWWYPWLRSISENHVAPLSLCLISSTVSMWCCVRIIALFASLMSMFMRICPGCFFSVMTLDIQAQFSFGSTSPILSDFLSSWYAIGGGWYLACIRKVTGGTVVSMWNFTDASPGFLRSFIRPAVFRSLCTTDGYLLLLEQLWHPHRLGSTWFV